MWWLIVLVIAVLAYLYSKGQSDHQKEQEEEITSSFTAEIIPISAENKDQESLKELSQPVESSSPQNISPAVFELIDFMSPRLKVEGKTMRVLEGNNRIIVWDSQRVNLLRKKFNVKNVMQRLEFREGDNIIEVYRALADDHIVTFVFPRENDDSDIIPLMTRSTTDDPSETSSRNKKKGVLDVMKEEPENVPSDLLPLIRDLQSSYATRQSSSGPKSIDTHRS